MTLPFVEETAYTRDDITRFGGYNNSETCSEAESHDEENMASDRSLLLTPREPRLVLSEDINFVKGIHVNNGLLVIRRDPDNFDNVLYFNDTRIAQLPGTGERQMCSMGAYVIIFPDKKRFNTLTNELESLEVDFTSSSTFTFTPCTLDGNTINPTVSSTMPTNPSNGAYWLDTSVTPNTLKVWSQSEGMWNAVPTSYVKISGTNIGKNFNKLDVVKISGVTGTYANTFNVDMCIWDKADDYIVVTAIINAQFTNTGITIKKEVPDMDFICEHGNRLWGCNSDKHEIYASKLGDPTNFKSYIGTAADAYAVTVGSDGDFTGCAEHGGTVVFFKEKFIHKIYGTTASNFQVDSKPEKGVQKGCFRSLALISGVLYYKAVDGVMRYEGSYPVLVSQNLGNTQYYNAEAGVWKGKYYIRMCSNPNNADGNTKLFCFDTMTGIWKIEDVSLAHFLRFFTSYKNRLIMWDSEEGRLIIEGKDRNFDGSTLAASTEEVIWSWESGLFGIDLPQYKYISQILVRLEMEEGSKLFIELQYDSGAWERVFSIENKYAESRRDTPGFTKLRSVEIPITPKRCDHMRMKIIGNGMSKVYSISKRIEGGGI